MDIAEYFETGPDFEQPIFEVVVAHLQRLDPDVWFEPVSVGIFFKRRSVFLSLRTMTKWIAVGFQLDHKLDDGRLSRKVLENGRRYHHVVNVKKAADIDEQLLDWITEAWACDGG